MRTKTLKPVVISQGLIDALEKEMVKLFKEQIYKPLVYALRESVVLNSVGEDKLIIAIQSGRVRYHQGVFRGKFNAAVSKALRGLGAKWDRKQKGYRIHLASLPSNAQNVIRVSGNRFNKKMEALDKKLSKLTSKKIIEQLSVKKFLSKSLGKVDTDIEETMRDFIIQPKFTKKAKNRLTEEYSKSLKLHIKDFIDEEVLSLRRKVKKNTLKGLRYDNIVEIIQKSYGVSKSKASFLARQETNLMVAKMKEIRYAEAGVDEYIWKNVIGSPAHPVRDSHKKLNNKKYKFTDPPAVNEKGDRKNPGEDYGCRCTAHPIVKF